MRKTFEELHPEIIQIIEERGYQTSTYERKEFGELKEYWEKDSKGIWHNHTERELHKAENKKRLRMLLAALAKARKEAGEYESGENS